MALDLLLHVGGLGGLGLDLLRGVLQHRRQPVALGLRAGDVGGELLALVQFADRIEDDFELRIILLFKCVELAREVSIGKKHFRQPNKRAHDCNVYLHGAFAAKDARKHRNTLFGESVGKIFRVLSALACHRV